MTKGELRKQRQAKHKATQESRAADPMLASANREERRSIEYDRLCFKSKRARRRTQDATREEQHGLYIDTGYGAWDDNGQE